MFVQLRMLQQDLILDKSFRLCDFRKLKKVETKNLMFDAHDEYLIKKTEEPE